MDAEKIRREKRLKDAKESIVEFINKTQLDNSKITNGTKSKLIKVVEEVYQDKEIFKKCDSWPEGHKKIETSFANIDKK